VVKKAKQIGRICKTWLSCQAKRPYVHTAFFPSTTLQLRPFNVHYLADTAFLSSSLVHVLARDLYNYVISSVMTCFFVLISSWINYCTKVNKIITNVFDVKHVSLIVVGNNVAGHARW